MPSPPFACRVIINFPEKRREGGRKNREGEGIEGKGGRGCSKEGRKAKRLKGRKKAEGWKDTKGRYIGLRREEGGER